MITFEDFDDEMVTVYPLWQHFGYVWCGHPRRFHRRWHALWDHHFRPKLYRRVDSRGGRKVC